MNHEIESKSKEPNLEHLNVFKPPLETITELKTKGFIKKTSPLWWSTDYEPDPREYVDFKEFRKRLFHLGICKTINRFPLSRSLTERDIYLYPKPEVPITILDLEISGQKLPFMITARPFHEKELSSDPISSFLSENKDLEKLKVEIADNKNKTIGLQQHFYPHIRGLFAGVKRNNFFWYPLAVNSFWYESGNKLQKALNKKRLEFIALYEPSYLGGRTYQKVWDELASTNLVSMMPMDANFPYKEVSAEEFVADQNGNDDLLVYYPFRTPTLKETLPLAVATRTHEQSNNIKPAVLGVYAENLPRGYGHKSGILRIKNLEFAKLISDQISKDFGIPIDTVLFTPQKGRPKYERIASV